MNVFGTIKQRVTRGIELLDRVRPSWDKSLDLEELNLGSSEFCVLGQVYGKDAIKEGEWAISDGFDLGRTRLFRRVRTESNDIEDFSMEFGFDQPHSNYDKIGREWKRQIKARRN